MGRDRGLSNWLTNLVASASLVASRYARTTILIVLVLTAVFAYGTTKLTTNVDVADVLPRGDGNTTAAKQLTKDFKSAFTLQVTLQFHVDEDGREWGRDNSEKIPGRRTQANARNITDEVYIRAMGQAIDFMKRHDELICCTIGVADLYKLINWTIEGGQRAPDNAWALPDASLTGESRYQQVDTGVKQAIASAVDALSSPDWRTTALLMTPSSTEDASTAEIGRRAIEARDAYVEWAESNPDEAYQVFTGDNFPRLTVELPVANAHSSELTKEDFGRLLPAIAVFIFIVLFIAFRNFGAVLITFSALALGTLWTYGFEGYMGIALNPLNLTLMPLIMGIGIDYSIHITNEFQEHKSKGLTHQAAFHEVGRRAGMALLIATLTTVVGLIIMAVSPSILIVEYGILASLSITIMYLLSIIYIPAALTLWPRSERMGAAFRPSKIVPFLATGVSKARGVVIVLVLVFTVIGSISAGNLFNEAFGDPGRNYLRSDSVRQEHEQGLRWFYNTAQPDVKANVITFEGDINDPAAHEYMREIERNLKLQPRVISDTLRTIPFLMETWLTVKDGAPGAAEYLARQRAAQSMYPQTREEIQSNFDALYGSPMRDLGSIFTNGPEGDYDLGVMTFSVRAATYNEAEEVWTQVWKSIDGAGAKKPADLKVSFVGNTATNYLFVAKEVPWVGYMGIAANVALFFFLLPFFRNWRAIGAIMLVNFATIAWWLGILPHLDIGLAITLVLPLIFISAVGTDYAVHVAWSIRQLGDAREVFETTGKAIFFSFVTTIGPFAIFMFIQDLSVRKTMIATVIAIVLIFVVTLLVLPSFFPIRPRPGKASVEHARGLPLSPPEEGPPTVAVKRPKPEPAATCR